LATASVGGRAAADEVIESHRFLRLVAIVDDGTPEARLWDASTNAKVRLKQSPGFDLLPLVKTAKSQLLVCGVVQKIEARQLIFRVGLYAVEPKAAADAQATPLQLYK